jgi:signal transduction histidine kinase
MAFTISARTILELGKELISSDEVAIYELIKNSVDAGSPKIRLEAQVILPLSLQKRALALLNRGEPTRTVFKEIAKAFPQEAPTDARNTFFAELERNLGTRKAFQSKLTELYRTCNWIRISDDGHGMSYADLATVFLRVGTPSRRSANNQGATYLGDKGVGRLSTMRLGDKLQVTTTMKGERKWHRLEIDWTWFSHDADDIDLNEIPFSPEEHSNKDDQQAHGTQILISSLTGEWSRARFDDMITGPIARLIDPFTPGRANKLLNVFYNSRRVLVPSIPPSLLNSAHATLRARFHFDDYDAPVLEGVIDYPLRHAQRKIFQQGPEILSMTTKVHKRRGKQAHAAYSDEPLDPATLADLGPFDCQVYWFNRRIVEKIGGLTENQTATKKQIANWAGGPMLYRHGFRILPYGDPDDDWLNLDVRAFGSGGFKLNRRQIIGQVNVVARHAALQEQTNREGLVKSDAFYALKAILEWLLQSEFRDLINDADEKETLTQKQAAAEAFTFNRTRDAVQASVKALRTAVPPEHIRELNRLEQQVMALAGECSALVSRLDETVQDAKEEREKFVHLAGIGLMTEFIFHELDRAVSDTLRMLAAARRSESASALSALEDQLRTLQKRVSSFDELTGARRQSKVNVDVADVASTVLQGHANEFRRHGIQAELEPGRRKLQVKAVRGMLIQILENLLANSIYWLKQQVAFELDFTPKLIVTVDPATKTIMVEDNGCGVAPDRAEIIFQPFVSSKPPEKGRGLGLYISRELAAYHGWELKMDADDGLYRAGRLNRFVLMLEKQT